MKRCLRVYNINWSPKEQKTKEVLEKIKFGEYDDCFVMSGKIRTKVSKQVPPVKQEYCQTYHS